MKAAQLVVKCLEAHGVEYIFGIPGAKIDAVFDALEDSSIELILCRHEQNAAFMAASYGRLTGKPGVVLVTSGPGVANLATGLLTATTEGDPVIAIGGNVARSMKLKSSHQNTENVKLMEAVTKGSVEASMAENIPEIFRNAFRSALAPRCGAYFVSLPQDVLQEDTNAAVLPPKSLAHAVANNDTIATATAMIAKAKYPVLFLGEEASRPEVTKAVRTFLTKTKIPTVGTFQAAGVVSRDLVSCFAGRVGLFQNQPGDQLLAKADLVITVGFDPVEYDPEVWNAKEDKKILHIDYIPAEIHSTYDPCTEVLGDIVASLDAINHALPKQDKLPDFTHAKAYHDELTNLVASGASKAGFPIHPLRFIHELRELVDDKTYVICDVGTVYMWMARYFLSYEPRHLLFSNGQQTLGVALPWAIAAKFAHPEKQVVSISGDGGFLFSAMELETAVREKRHFVHFVWRDGTYNMVKEQELMKYQRKSGVDFGKVDMVNFAEAFGAKGYELKSADDIAPVFKEAMAANTPVLIDVHIDYSDNPELFLPTDPHLGH